MARIAMDEANPVELRARMYAELAGYVAAKRKAVDLLTDDEGAAEPLTINVRVVKPPVWAEEEVLPPAVGETANRSRQPAASAD
jgi:hypothetical protein